MQKDEGCWNVSSDVKIMYIYKKYLKFSLHHLCCAQVIAGSVLFDVATDRIKERGRDKKEIDGQTFPEFY